MAALDPIGWSGFRLLTQAAAPGIDRIQLGRSLEIVAYRARNRTFKSTSLQRKVVNEPCGCSPRGWTGGP